MIKSLNLLPTYCILLFPKDNEYQPATNFMPEILIFARNKSLNNKKSLQKNKKTRQEDEKPQQACSTIPNSLRGVGSKRTSGGTAKQ